MTEWLQAWAISQGAPPEVAARLALASVAPMSPSQDALARAVVALEADAVAAPAEGWREVRARVALMLLCTGAP